MLHSPKTTRSQTAEARQMATTSQEVDAGAPALLAAMRELRQLREERERERSELQELRRSQSNEQQGQRETQGQCHFNSLNLKPDIYDGTEPFYEYISQFELIARANAWNEGQTALVFAANLRGKARSILDGMGNNLDYTELKSKLELRFGERNCFQGYYSQFTNKKMKFGEDFASYGEELEKLVRMAYPECTYEVRDKIACAQFIAGIPESLVKQTLQLENIMSLRNAIERAKIVQSISREKESFNDQYFKKEFYSKKKL